MSDWPVEEPLDNGAILRGVRNRHGQEAWLVFDADGNRLVDAKTRADALAELAAR